VQDLTVKGKHRKTRTKKQPFNSILTLDDLDKDNWKHSLLITQLQARYQTLKKSGNGQPNQPSEDFSI